MNLDRLRAVQAEEREADSLRPLPDSFYREVAEYLAELREERAGAAASADDPFGDEDVRRLTDEIETAEEVAEALYERRVGKLVKRACLAAAGMPADEEGLTAEEAELFADLVDKIEDHRATVLDSFDAGEERGGPVAGQTATGDADRAEPSGGRPADAGAEAGTSGRSADEEGRGAAGTGSSGDGTDPPDPSPEQPGEGPEPSGDDAGAGESTDGGRDPERVTLRITRDVGEVFGVDERTYELAAEDVVTLPAANAKPLLERDAAEQID